MHEANAHDDITFMISRSDIKLTDDSALIDPLVGLKENKFP